MKMFGPRGGFHDRTKPPKPSARTIPRASTTPIRIPGPAGPFPGPTGPPYQGYWLEQNIKMQHPIQETNHLAIFSFFAPPRIRGHVELNDACALCFDPHTKHSHGCHL